MNFTQAEQNVKQEDAQLDKYLTFTVGDEEYGIEIRFVTEIIGMQPINTLPEVPGYVKGVINLRGKIIPVVDMCLRFGKEETPYTDRTCIVVVETEHLTTGLIVDQVSEVMVIGEESIVPPPNFRLKASRRYLNGIGKVGTQVKLLINCEKLFDGSELEKLTQI